MCIDRHSRIALALVASALAVYPFASASSATPTKDNAEVVDHDFKQPPKEMSR